MTRREMLERMTCDLEAEAPARTAKAAQAEVERLLCVIDELADRAQAALLDNHQLRAEVAAWRSRCAQCDDAVLAGQSGGNAAEDC